MIPLLFVSTTGVLIRTIRTGNDRFCMKKVRQRGTPNNNSNNNRRARMTFSPPPKDNSPDSDADNGGSDVDWNESWTRFRASGMVSDAPAGRQPPTEAEKAARRAQQVLEDTKGKLPSREVVLADWRFWIGLLLVLSLFTAWVNASHTYVSPTATNGMI